MAVCIDLIATDKKRFLDLLLLADEQESMVDRYLASSDLFILQDEGVKSVCAVIYAGNGCFELKNIATYPQFQNRGYAKLLIGHVLAYYKGKGKTLLVGTGDIPGIIGFYQRRGFVVSHLLKMVYN